MICRRPVHPVHRLLRRLAYGLLLAGMPARAMPLAEALGLSFDRDGAVRAAAEGVGRARAEHRAAWGRFAPEVSFQARSTWIEEPIVIDLEPIRGAMLRLHPQVPPRMLPPFRLAVQDDWYQQATLQATLPLFAGGRLVAGERAAGAAVRAAEAQERQAQSQMAYEVATRYFAARLAQEAVGLREQALADMEAHAEKARRLEEGGQIARAERLRAEVALAEARREREDARSQAELARIALRQTIGIETEAEPTDSLFVPRGASNVDSLATAALAAHPGLARLGEEEARARQARLATWGEGLPNVALFGQRELWTRDLTLLQPEWAVGIHAQWTLFRGGQTVARAQAARHLEREVAARRRQAARDVELLVRKRHRELRAALDQFGSLEATRELAEESVRAQQAAFAEGVASSLEVVDAELALSRVRLARLKALHDADVALAGILDAVGDAGAITQWMGGSR